MSTDDHHEHDGCGCGCGDGGASAESSGLASSLMDMMGHGAPNEETSKANAEKIKMGQDLKEEGNAKFRAGDAKGATDSYNRSLLYVTGISNLSAEDTRTVKEMRITLELNIAAAMHKLGRNDRALLHSKKAVELCGGKPTAKALFRRGRAYRLHGDLDEAKADLEAAAALEPANKDVRQELETTVAAIKAFSEKEKKKYASVLSRMSDSDA